MNVVAWWIAASEIAFWVVILSGLAARYALGRKKLGWFLLALTPVIDLVLLTVASMDLYRGSEATRAHGLAAVYIAVSLVFGKSMVRWADERFQHYVTKQGPKPMKRYGLDHARHYFNGWVKHLLAYLLGSGLLFGLILWIGDPERTEALAGTWKLWSLVLAIDLMISATYFIWPRKAKA
ncbi:hypothetical protein [Cohnella caldifontis]|uniref:hypothetical protein n=1 Tax=Cohnella caldifontis TaxID=3027471 RepID=UPI0023ED2AE6|nr:hypothetical protein [Cohnella sp. YIM B05605]